MGGRSGPPSLRDLDLSPTLAKDEYETRLDAQRLALLRLQHRLRDARARALVVVFEGMDAAGKGGAIRRLTGRLDPRGFRVHAIGAPSREELAHDFLWRFAGRMPAWGEISIFDRSWYGRVLVERVEGLCRPRDWERAFGEIEDFERRHVASGTVIVKFWLHVSKQEQLRRFRERERDPFKEYKITDEDWRNRRKWKHYVGAAEEMLRRTHGHHAPWTVVSGEDKRWARVMVVETVVRRLSAAL